MRLYPRAYRERFSSEMEEVVGEMLAAAPSRAARARIWLAVVGEMPASLVVQHANVLHFALRNETPRYVKHNAIVCGLLLVPFTLAIAANSISRMILGQDLNHSWLWSTPAIWLWAIWLPQAALIVAAVSWLAYIWHGSARSRLSRAFDVRHGWPIMVSGMMAGAIIFMIFFHDSVHCWIQNPVTTVTHWQQTVLCSNGGVLGGRS